MRVESSLDSWEQLAIAFTVRPSGIFADTDNPRGCFPA